MLYMVCHGSHQYTSFMLALIYQHHGSYSVWICLESGMITRRKCQSFMTRFSAIHLHRSCKRPRIHPGRYKPTLYALVATILLLDAHVDAHVDLPSGKLT